MSESLVEFFQNKGAIALLGQINPLGSTFEELVDDLPIARGTVSKRLNEAQALGLIRKEIVKGDPLDTSAPPEYYFPTKRGMALHYQLIDRDLTMLSKRLQELQARFETQAELFTAHVKEEEEIYMDLPTTIDDGVIDHGLFDSRDHE